MIFNSPSLLTTLLIALAIGQIAIPCSALTITPNSEKPSQICTDENPKRCYDRVRPSEYLSWPLNLVLLSQIAEKMLKPEGRAEMDHQTRKQALGISYLSEPTRRYILENFDSLVLEHFATGAAQTADSETRVPFLGTLTYKSKQGSKSVIVHFSGHMKSEPGVKKTGEDTIEASIASLVHLDPKDLDADTLKLIQQIALPALYSQQLIAPVMDSVEESITKMFRGFQGQ